MSSLLTGSRSLAEQQQVAEWTEAEARELAAAAGPPKNLVTDINKLGAKMWCSLLQSRKCEVFATPTRPRLFGILKPCQRRGRDV